MQHIRLHGDAATSRKWVNWAKNKLTQLLTLQGDPDTFHKRYSFADVDIKLSKVAPDEYIDIYGKGNYLLIVWLGTQSHLYDVKKFFNVTGDALVETSDLLNYIDDGLYELDFTSSPASVDNLFDATFNKDGGGLQVPAGLTCGYDSKGPSRYILNAQNYFNMGVHPFHQEWTYSDGAHTADYYYTTPIVGLIHNYMSIHGIASHELVYYGDENILYSASGYDFDGVAYSIVAQHIESDNYNDYLMKHSYFSYIPLNGDPVSHFPLHSKDSSKTHLEVAGLEFKSGGLVVPRYFDRDARDYMGVSGYETHIHYQFYEPIDIVHVDATGTLTFTPDLWQRTWDNTDPDTHNGYFWINSARRLDLIDGDDLPPDPAPTPSENDVWSYARYVAYPHGRIPFGAYGVDGGDYVEVTATSQVATEDRWDNSKISLYLGGKLVESHVQAVESSDPWRYWRFTYPTEFVAVFEYSYYPLNVFHDKQGNVAAVYARVSRQSFAIEDMAGWSVVDQVADCAPDVTLYDPANIATFRLLKTQVKVEYFLYFNERLTKLTYTDGSPLYTDQMEYCPMGTSSQLYYDDPSGWYKKYVPYTGNSFINRGYDYSGNELSGHDTRFVGRAYLSMDSGVCLAMLEIFDMKICNKLITELPTGFLGCEYSPNTVWYDYVITGSYDDTLSTDPYPPSANNSDSELGHLVDRVGVIIQEDGNKQYLKGLDTAFSNPSSGTGSPYKCINGIGLFKF